MHSPQPAGSSESNARTVIRQNLIEHLPMGREEKSILLSAGSRLRFNDMGKPGYWNRGLFDVEYSTCWPDCLEIEPTHHQRQVHVGTHPVAGAGERASLDHRARALGVLRFVKRLRSGEQIESVVSAHTPGNEEIPRVRGQEQVAIEGREHRAAGWRVVVRAANPDHQVAYSLRRERTGKRGEPVHRFSVASPNSGDVPRRRAPGEPSSCRCRTRCSALLRDEGFADGSRGRARPGAANRPPDLPVSSSRLPNVPPPFPHGPRSPSGAADIV